MVHIKRSGTTKVISKNNGDIKKKLSGVLYFL